MYLYIYIYIYVYIYVYICEDSYIECINYSNLLTTRHSSCPQQIQLLQAQYMISGGGVSLYRPYIPPTKHSRGMYIYIYIYIYICICMYIYIYIYIIIIT